MGQEIVPIGNLNKPDGLNEYGSAACSLEKCFLSIVEAKLMVETFLKKGT